MMIFQQSLFEGTFQIYPSNFFTETHELRENLVDILLKFCHPLREWNSLGFIVATPGDLTSASCLDFPRKKKPNLFWGSKNGTEKSRGFKTKTPTTHQTVQELRCIFSSISCQEINRFEVSTPPFSCTSLGATNKYPALGAEGWEKQQNCRGFCPGGVF